MLRGDLIGRNVLFRKSGRLLFLHPGQERMHGAMSALCIVIEMREDGEVLPIGLQRGERLAECKLAPIRRRENPSGQKPR